MSSDTGTPHPDGAAPPQSERLSAGSGSGPRSGSASTSGDWRSALNAEVAARADFLRGVRRHLHAHPEPSGEEYETTEFVAQCLRQAGLTYRIVPSRRGLIVDTPADNASHPKRRIGLRADMDALRLQDAKVVPYRSTRDGVMHACGHDAHTTMVLGAILALDACREVMPWRVPWRAIFQPAEETAQGAKEMVACGALDQIRTIIALHVDPELPVGQVGQKPGVLTACCEEVIITITGKGGHAARPHQGIDPIAVATQLLGWIYQQVPRAIDSRDPTVITFGSIHGGASANVIPSEVTIMGTIRTLSRATTAAVEDRVRRIAHGLAEATQAVIHVEFRRMIDAVVNDPDVTAVYAKTAAEIFGSDHVRTIALPSMGAEDFSGYLSDIPGAMLRLGVASEGSPRYLLHNPHFDVDERALVLGAQLLARAVVALAGTDNANAT